MGVRGRARAHSSVSLCMCVLSVLQVQLHVSVRSVSAVLLSFFTVVNAPRSRLLLGVICGWMSVLLSVCGRSQMRRIARCTVVAALSDFADMVCLKGGTVVACSFRFVVGNGVQSAKPPRTGS